MSVTTAFFPKDEFFMRLALREAERAVVHDDVPIGCVIARDGEVVAAFPNERELRQDPTAHCEILALREAANSARTWRLGADVLYVTLEPCAMCAGAIVLARIPRVVYGATDPKAGAAGSWRLNADVLYVSLEPCAMGAGAIVLARVPRVIYGATDPKAGAAGSVFNVLAEPKLNWRPDVAAGLLADDSAVLLRSFFASRR